MNWTKIMIRALIDMSLAMWKNWSGILHGHTKENCKSHVNVHQAYGEQIWKFIPELWRYRWINECKKTNLILRGRNNAYTKGYFY